MLRYRRRGISRSNNNGKKILGPLGGQRIRGPCSDNPIEQKLFDALLGHWTLVLFFLIFQLNRSHSRPVVDSGFVAVRVAE